MLPLILQIWRASYIALVRKKRYFFRYFMQPATMFVICSQLKIKVQQDYDRKIVKNLTSAMFLFHEMNEINAPHYPSAGGQNVSQPLLVGEQGEILI
jgi:hypothetical protein